MWDARHFHSRFLGDHVGYVGVMWLCYPSPSCPSISLESVHNKESICLFAFPSKTWFPLLVLWLSGHLDCLFWQHCHLWLTLLIGSICLEIYPYQLPPHPMGLSPSIPDGHMEWQSHLVLRSRVLIDKLVESHNCWGYTWHDFSGWLLRLKRLFIFRAVSPIYMLLLPFISTFRNHFPVSKSHRHLQESVTSSP